MSLQLDVKEINSLFCNNFTTLDMMYLYDYDDRTEFESDLNHFLGKHFEVQKRMVSDGPKMDPVTKQAMIDRIEKSKVNPDRVEREIFKKITKWAGLGKMKSICIALDMTEKELDKITKKKAKLSLKDFVEKYNTEAVLDIGVCLLEKGREGKDTKVLLSLGEKLIEQLAPAKTDININIDQREVRIIEMTKPPTLEQLMIQQEKRKQIGNQDNNT